MAEFPDTAPLTIDITGKFPTSFLSDDQLLHVFTVVQKFDNAIHWINHYPLDSAIGFPNTYSLDIDSGAPNVWYNCPFLTDFYPKKVTLEFSGAFLLAQILEKVSFDPYNFRIDKEVRTDEKFVGDENMPTSTASSQPLFLLIIIVMSRWPLYISLVVS